LVQGVDDKYFFVVGLVHAASTDGTAIVAYHFHQIMNDFGVDVTPWS